MNRDPKSEAFLQELEDYMNNNCTIGEGAIRTYIRKINNLLKTQCSVDDLCGAIDRFVREYGAGGAHYNEKDSGNTRAALQKVRQLVRKKLLDEAGGLFCIL